MGNTFWVFGYWFFGLGRCWRGDEAPPMLPPNACRGERRGVWGRVAPIRSVRLDFVFMPLVGAQETSGMRVKFSEQEVRKLDAPAAVFSGI